MAFAPFTRQSFRAVRVLAFVSVFGLLLAGCANTSGEESDYPEQYGNSGRMDPFGKDAVAQNEGGRLFGPNGIQLFGFGGDNNSAAGIGINSFLWRASLDTVSFMPLTTTDPFGGVIITDWYQTPESPEERFKLTVFILDRELRADGVRVNAFRQERVDRGQWDDAAIDPEVAAQIENAILTRARQLRVAHISE